MRPLPLVTAAVLAVSLLLPAQAATASVEPVPTPTPTATPTAVPTPTPAPTPAPAPPRDQGPYEIFLTPFDGTIYELVDGRSPRPLSFQRFRDVYDERVPFLSPTDYVKYPWSSTVYAVTFWPGGENAWQWTRLGYSQYERAGFPAVRNAGYIVNSYIYKWGTSAEILVEGEDKVNHKLTGAEWRDMAYRPFDDRANEGFMKLSWTSDIVRMTDVRGGQGRAIGYGEWQEEAFPTPQVVQRINGDQFYRYSNSNQVWYAGPGMNRVVSFNEYRGAGSPAVRVIQVAGQPTPPPSSGGGGGGGSVFYANCAAVKRAGKAPLYAGQPGYSFDLDRDRDGVACEN
ncbi:excalibur calcium-binding domain-containing protein [Clavibacter capsici]|uniref:excalibur calcium-binding domain-containing protein n=1 Tax=Clavibacter capsici TaxID=1874630 RepID=UPI00293EB09A|nr:excalibur calcium-binding domain-containing protein [Clavibacter capsici]